MSHLDAAASRLQSATEELRTKETILQRASANLNKLQLSDPPASEETLAKAKLGVAEAKLGVAEEANETPQRLAELQWKVAEAKWEVADAEEKGEARLATLQREIDLWREMYQSYSGQLWPSISTLNF